MYIMLMMFKTMEVVAVLRSVGLHVQIATGECGVSQVFVS